MTTGFRRGTIGVCLLLGATAGLGGCAAKRASLPPLSELLTENERLNQEFARLSTIDRPWLPGGDPNDPFGGPVMACFSSEAEVSPETVFAVNQLIQNSLLKYNINNRWANTFYGPTGAVGNPITLTWSLVPDNTQAPNLSGTNGNSVLFATMDTLFGIANRALWIGKIQQGLDRWGALTGVSYVRVTNGTDDWDDGAPWTSFSAAGHGDVRIAMRPLDGANGVLAFNSYPSTLSGNGGNMVMDSGENWANAANDYRFMRNIIMHEHGHGLGIAHVCPTNGTKLMEPFLVTTFDGPQQDDLRAVHANYGDAYEPNNGSTSAAVIGPVPFNFSTGIGSTPAPNVTNAAITALSTSGDEDWFRVNLAGNAALVTVQLLPQGTSYSTATQNGGGGCNTSTTTNALTAANPSLEVRGTTGLNSLGQSTAAAAGANENLNSVLVGGGFCYVRIWSASWTGTQEYKLVVTTAPALTLNATDGVFADKVLVTWSAVPNVASYDIYRGTTNVRADATLLASSATSNYDDTTAVPGTTYYYWVRAQQTGSSTAFDIAGPDSGFIEFVPPACVVDIGVQGGGPGQDGVLDNNDFVVFIEFFFLDNLAVDFGVQGGVPGQDGVLDNNDFAVFIDLYFAGCP